VLSDLVLNPVFASEEITRERGVILEEIKMDEDNPDTLVHEIFTQSFWKDHPLGKPILGTRETVKSFEQNTLLRFFEQRFRADNMVFSAAGNLEHDSFVELVARHFSSLAPGSLADDTVAPTVTSRINLRNKKSLEQVQLCLGVPAPPIADSCRYATLLLNTLLGGGMSSRLFQTVREERGLVYSIYSDLNPYRDTGSLCVYAGTSADRALQVIDLIMEEFRRMKTEPLPADELRRGKDQLKGNLLLSLESSMSRMSNLARQQMYFERFFGLEEILEKVESVTEEQVMAMAEKLFQPDRVAVTLLGRLDGLKLGRKQLDC
jgi:predicted Zn-dependent peptidase